MKRFSVILVAVAALTQAGCGTPLQKLVWAPAGDMVRAQENPLGITGRRQAIKKYLSHRKLTLIEGVWVWSNNKYEVLIVKNPLTKRYPDYDYVGVLTSSNERGWDKGNVKLLLKSTAVNSVFSGTYIAANNSRLGTTFFLSNNNLIETTLPGNIYRYPEKLALIRMYPKSSSGNENTASVAMGTGFFISASLVATNYHVIASASSVNVYVGNTKHKATPVLHDQKTT